MPVHDDQKHFEFLSSRARRPGCRGRRSSTSAKAIGARSPEFDPAKVARFTPAKIEKILLDPGHRAKPHEGRVRPCTTPAFLKLVDELGSFDEYIWVVRRRQADRQPLEDSGQIPATSKQSDALAADLKKRGFKFVGSTVMYAHIQAAGLINDHLVGMLALERSAALAMLLRRSVRVSARSGGTACQLDYAVGSDADGDLDARGLDTAIDARVITVLRSERRHLVACYTSRTPRRRIGHNLDATTMNVTFPSGKVGNAMQFASNSAADVAESALWDMTAITIEAWMNRRCCRRRGARMGILDKNGQYDSSSTSNGRLVCAIVNGISAQFDADIPTNAWTHVACTYDGTTTTIYANGAILFTAAVAARSRRAVTPVFRSQPTIPRAPDPV